MKTIGRPIYGLVLFGFILVSLFFVLGGSARAADDVNNLLPNDAEEAVARRLLVATAGTEFGSPDSYARLYVPTTNSSATVTLKVPSNNMHLTKFSVSRLASGVCQPTTSVKFDPRNGNSLSTPDSTGADTITGIYKGITTTFKIFCVQVSTGYLTDPKTGKQIFDQIPFYLETNVGLLGNQKSTINGTGYNKDDLITSYGTKWEKKIAFGTPCSAASAPAGYTANSTIYLYDLDYGHTPGWVQEAIPVTLVKENLVTRTVTAVSFTVTETLAVGAKNVLVNGNIQTTGEHKNFYLNITDPGGVSYGYKYTLTLGNINSINTIKIGLASDQVYAAFICGENPVGYVDSCEMVGNTVVIKGWAYDDDSTIGADPAVSLNVTGYSSSTISSNVNLYRYNEINGFLNGRGYGSRARDDTYGFTTTYEGMYKGTTYTLSGSVLNVGAGADQQISIREELSRLDLAGYGFKDNIIPDQCLPDRPPPLACVVPPIAVAVGQDFYLKVQVSNSGSTDVDIPASATANYTLSFDGVTKKTGAGKPYDVNSNTYLNFPQRVPAGKSITIWSEGLMSVDSAGLYDVKWDIAIASGINAGGDCGKVETGAVEASTNPYVKFFGNDVIAGGGFSGDCAVNSFAKATGYGMFSTVNHAGYKGSSSELAVFASGQIDGVLPGSQDTTSRSSLTQLSFANTSDGLGVLPFGGMFEGSLCIDNFWAEKPENTDLEVLPTQTDNAYNPAINKVDLASLVSDEYYYFGDVHLYASRSIPLSRRITVYVEGNTIIGRPGHVTYDDKIAYETAGWTDLSMIPLVKIITLGNIFIDDNVSQIDGMLVSVADSGSIVLGGPSGEIHTCSQFDGARLNLVYPDQETSALALSCGHRLEVNGAFVAKNIRLLRTNGNYYSAANAPEPYSSANIAEVFRFSPELYLAMLSSGSNQIMGKFDSVLSLPPAL